jgi:hypothetical protein
MSGGVGVNIEWMAWIARPNRVCGGGGVGNCDWMDGRTTLALGALLTGAGGGEEAGFKSSSCDFVVGSTMTESFSRVVGDWKK